METWAGFKVTSPMSQPYASSYMVSSYTETNYYVMYDTAKL